MRCANCGRTLAEEATVRYPIDGASTAGRTVVLCKSPCRRSPMHPRTYPTR